MTTLQNKIKTLKRQLATFTTWVVMQQLPLCNYYDFILEIVYLSAFTGINTCSSALITLVVGSLIQE